MTTIERGRTVADVLRGIWRSSTKADLTIRQLADVSELLQNAGLSGFIWNRLAPPARRTPLGQEFRRSALADAGAAAKLDVQLIEVVRALRAAGVEPIVTKGWAVARYYPTPASRPYCDLDLAIRSDDATVARNALNALGARVEPVDLHIGIPDLAPATWSEIFARTQKVWLDGCPIRALAVEDQFRLLVAHLLRHFCDRPMNLIDVAVLLEHESNLDWDSCLQGSHAWRRWVLAVAELARRMLDAHLPDALAESAGRQAPAWFEEGTLWRWGGGEAIRRSEWIRTPAEWRPVFAYRTMNLVRWPYGFGMPPLRLTPPIWAAAIFGRGILPLHRLCRRQFSMRKSKGDAFQTHRQNVF
jgi:hypothetical protein